MAHGREESVKKRECRSLPAGVHGFEPRRVEKWRRSTFPAQVTACARSPQRVPAPCNVDDARPPNPRWASADLSLGFSIQIQAWPVHHTRPKSRSEFHRRIDNVSSREVSKDGGSTARRRPNLSITSPYELIVDSTCRQPPKADCRFCTGRLHTVPPSFARFQKHVAPRERLFPHTEPLYEVFIRSLRHTSSFDT